MTPDKKTKTMNKGQTALEFLVLTGFMLFIFTGFFFVIEQRDVIATQRTQYSELVTIADAISQEVSNAYRVHDGYARTFNLPPSINGVAYNITATTAVGAEELTIKTNDFEYIVFLPAPISLIDIATNLPTTTWAPGDANVTKQNGAITFKVMRCTPDCSSFQQNHYACGTIYPAPDPRGCGMCSVIGSYCTTGLTNCGGVDTGYCCQDGICIQK